MPIILKEDEGKKLGSKKAVVPKKLSTELNKRKGVFSDYKKSRGWKRLNALTGDYNRRSDASNMTSDGRKIVSFSNLKKLDYDMRHMKPTKDNLEYQMLGQDTKQWVHDQLGKIRSANKEVPQVKPVPKLEKPSDASVKDDGKLKVGGADFKVTENRKKVILLPESKLHTLLEYRGQLMFNPDEDGNFFYGKFNYQHYIDFLEHIGRYGTLKPSGMDYSDLLKMIEDNKEAALDDYYTENVDDEDAYDTMKYVVAKYMKRSINSDESQILSDMAIKLARDAFEEYGSDAYMEEVIDDNIDGANFNLFDLLTTNGFEEVKKESMDITWGRLYDYGFDLKMNDRGLVYVERALTIPFSRAYKNREDGKDTFSVLSDSFRGVGNCWSWKKGSGEAYNGVGYREGSSTILLRGFVNPKDINWIYTLSRNMYGLRSEMEIFLDGGTEVEVFSVMLLTKHEPYTCKDNFDNNIELIEKPIIVKA